MSDLVPYKPSKEELTLWFMTQGEWDALPVEVRRQVGIKSTSAQRFCHMTELMHEVDPENWEPQVYRPSPVQQPEEFEYPITNDIAYQHVPITRAPIPVSGDGVTTLSPTQLEQHGAERRVLELAFIPPHESAIDLFSHTPDMALRPTKRLLEGIAVQQHYHAWNRGEGKDQCLECSEGARFEVCRNLFIVEETTDGAYNALGRHQGEWYRDGACASCIALNRDCSLQRYRNLHILDIESKQEYEGRRRHAARKGEHVLQRFLDQNFRGVRWDTPENTTAWNHLEETVPPECELRHGP